MRVYRVAYRAFAKDPLDGEGSFLYGGRWSSPGTRIAYTSSSLALVMLEFLANVGTGDFDRASPPALVYVSAVVLNRDIATLKDFGVGLPSNWDDVPAPAADATVGDEWAKAGRSVGLFVPSIHVPAATGEKNVLLNPRHPHFTRVSWKAKKLEYDPRLLAILAPRRRSR